MDPDQNDLSLTVTAFFKNCSYSERVHYRDVRIALSLAEFHLLSQHLWFHPPSQEFSVSPILLHYSKYQGNETQSQVIRPTH